MASYVRRLRLSDDNFTKLQPFVGMHNLARTALDTWELSRPTRSSSILQLVSLMNSPYSARIAPVRSS